MEQTQLLMEEAQLMSQEEFLTMLGLEYHRRCDAFDGMLQPDFSTRPEPHLRGRQPSGNPWDAVRSGRHAAVVRASILIAHPGVSEEELQEAIQRTA